MRDLHTIAQRGARPSHEPKPCEGYGGEGDYCECGISPGTVSPKDNPDVDHAQPTLLSFMGRMGADRENAKLICSWQTIRQAAYLDRTCKWMAVVKTITKKE